MGTQDGDKYLNAPNAHQVGVVCKDLTHYPHLVGITKVSQL